PSFVRQTVDDLKQWLAYSISILRYGKVVEEDPFARAVKGLEDNLALKAREDTYVFEIKYTGKKQQLAADVANTLAKSFIEFMDEVRLSENQYTRDRLQPQLKQSRQQLDDARDRLEDYKKQHAVFLHEDEYKAKLREISDVELELTKAEEALVASQSSPASVSLAAKRTRLVRLLQERRAELA